MPTLTDTVIGARIRARRRALGLNLKTIADAVGISCQQVQKYETGANGIGPGRLQRIAQILDVSVAYLFGSSESLSSASRREFSSEINVFIACSDCMDLSHAYLKITDRETRQRVIDIVETLANGRAPALVQASAGGFAGDGGMGFHAAARGSGNAS